MKRLNYINETTYRFRFKKDFEQILIHAEKEFKFKKTISVDFVLIDDVKMQEISKEYRNKDKTTDILSFPSNWEDFTFLDIIPLGEILISYQKVKDQAKEYGHTIRREFCYLFAHGIAHLYGLDHLTKEEEDNMNFHVDNIMKKMEITR